MTAVAHGNGAMVADWLWLVRRRGLTAESAYPASALAARDECQATRVAEPTQDRRGGAAPNPNGRVRRLGGIMEAMRRTLAVLVLSALVTGCAGTRASPLPSSGTSSGPTPSAIVTPAAPGLSASPPETASSTVAASGATGSGIASPAATVVATPGRHPAVDATSDTVSQTGTHPVSRRVHHTVCDSCPSPVRRASLPSGGPAWPTALLRP